MISTLFQDSLALILLHSFCSDIFEPLSYGANSEVTGNSDKFISKHCLHFNTSYSIVLSLIVSEHIKESTIRYFNWYHAQNQDRVLDSGGALCKKDKYLPSS